MKGKPMRRREFIAGLGAAAWPVAARAQQRSLPVIGVLHAGSPGGYAPYIEAFRAGLNDIGFVQDRNLTMEFRWAESHYARLSEFADDLVRRKVAVIATLASTEAALAAKRATNSIPIVFSIGADPVEAGLVASLNKPGGNLTGTALLITAVVAKRLELLHELVPTAMLLGFLVNPTDLAGAKYQTRELQVAANLLGVRLLPLNASDPSEFETAFEALVRARAGGLLVGGDSLFSVHFDQLATLAARYRVPAIYARREATTAGGLMSYGARLSDAYRVAGTYVGRILKGEKPADLPVQQSTRVEMVLNLKAAKALGLTVPNTLLVAADEVIE